jgi:hypothetical protein
MLADKIGDEAANFRQMVILGFLITPFREQILLESAELLFPEQAFPVGLDFV